MGGSVDDWNGVELAQLLDAHFALPCCQAGKDRMSTQTIVIRACSNCHTDLADPDYGGTLCGECADEMLLTCKLEWRKVMVQQKQRWTVAVIGSVLCVVMALMYCAGGYGLFVLARQIVRWAE
jgi:hypothetical protein